MLHEELILFLAVELKIHSEKIRSMITAKDNSLMDECVAMVRQETEWKECNDPRFRNYRLIIAQGIIEDFGRLIEEGV